MSALRDRMILGIWDGHDAGAALIEGERVLFAVNEERLTRRKLEVGFPELSITACLRSADLAPADIPMVAASTTDPAKTLTRLLPGLKEEYYLIRRRKRVPHRADPFRKAFKYRFTELPPNPFSAALSRAYMKRRLARMGFADFRLEWVEHHAAHAAAAAACSGFPEALVLTLDGVGDGLCGSLRIWRNGRFELLKALPARTSLGIFFEHVTNLMNMRELEDEGKVMALANYAYPIPDEENPLMALIGTKGLDIVSPYRSTRLFAELRKLLWRFPSEQFAFMAQRVLEKNVLSLVEEALARTGLKRLAAAGGVFSNVKMNMRLAELPSLERLYVFPHMGDGGLAIGAALAANRERNGVAVCHLDDLFLGPLSGPRLPDSDVEGRPASPASRPGFRVRRLERPEEEAARLILEGEIVLWFQGRMEIGPRALGHRSILARPDDRLIKDRLNLLLKKRVWYQPFCPSLLIEDAPALLETDGQQIRDNRFMTMGFHVRPEHRSLMEGVSNIDATCRPHFVADEDPRYRRLLLRIKEALGWGVVLNTSFNLHGEPVVCSPAEALDVLGRTGFRYLFLEDLLIENTLAANR
jgi:carbamoyltransferase